MLHLDNWNLPNFTTVYAVKHLAPPRALLKGTSAVVKEEESIAHSLPLLRGERRIEDCICPLILTLVWP